MKLNLSKEWYERMSEIEDIEEYDKYSIYKIGDGENDWICAETPMKALEVYMNIHEYFDMDLYSAPATISYMLPHEVLKVDDEEKTCAKWAAEINSNDILATTFI